MGKKLNAMSSDKNYDIAKNAFSEVKASEFVSIESDGTEAPLYFMQIISVNEDEMNLKIIANKMEKEKRFIRVCQMTELEHAKRHGMNRKVKIRKNEISRTFWIDLPQTRPRKHDIDLALYDVNNLDVPLPHTNILTLTAFENRPNENYKPNPIDLSTVFKVMNENEKTANIYWSCPVGSYGDISYKIVNDDDEKE